MKNHAPCSRPQALLLGLGLLLASSQTHAYELRPGGKIPPVDFHGFASQGYLKSTDYNYLGETIDGSDLFTELGLNASVNPLPRTRIAAQAFSFNIGRTVGDYDIVLDYGLIEYTFNDQIGIRLGRIRRPVGIYNHIQDVDLARTFVLLPQGLYDARWRDFYASIDGGEIFGTLSLKKAGNLAYDLYYGRIRPKMNGGMASLLSRVLPANVTLEGIDPNRQLGTQLWWNTAVEGLRLGLAINYNFDFNARTAVRTPFATIRPNNKQDIFVRQLSGEYTWDNWTLQAEYYRYTLYPETTAGKSVDAWYAAASRRLCSWFEAGAYYTEYFNDTHQRNIATLYQKDLALALRFDVTDWWLFKIEGHYIRGTGLLQNPKLNPVQRDNGWTMLALKSTISF